jgi:hypothetical protein
MCLPSMPISAVVSKRECKSVLIAYIGLQPFWIFYFKERGWPDKYLYIAVVDSFVNDELSRPTAYLDCFLLKHI